MTLQSVNKINITDILQCQKNKHGVFNRFDIIVKYLYIVAFFNQEKNIDIHYKKCYRDMATSKLSDVDKDQVINARIKSFNSLITTIQNNNFNTKLYPIQLTAKSRIWNGAHRVATSIFTNCNDIYYISTNRTFKRDSGFTINHFEQAGFNQDFIQLMQEVLFNIVPQMKIR